MKLRKLVSLTLCGVLTLTLLTSCGGSSSGSGTTNPDIPSSSGADGEYEYPEITLVSADFAPEDNAIAITTRFFIDELTKRSDGRITVEENFGGTLLGSMALYEGIATGQVDFGTISPLFNPSDLPLTQISCSVPFGTTDGKVVSDAMNQLMASREEFEAEYEKAGIVNLFNKGTESYTLMTKNRIDTIDGLRGEKVAVGGVYYPSCFEALGCVCTAADSSAAYQHLKTNVFSSFWAFDSSYVQYSLYEVCKYVLDMNGGARCTQALVFNRDKFQSMDEPTQQLILECADAAYDQYNEWLAAQMDSWRQDMLDNGVEYIVMSDAEKQAWADAIFAQETNSIQKWIDSAGASGYDGASIMAEYLTILQDAGVEFPYDISMFVS